MERPLSETFAATPSWTACRTTGQPRRERRAPCAEAPLLFEVRVGQGAPSSAPVPGIDLAPRGLALRTPTPADAVAGPVNGAHVTLRLTDPQAGWLCVEHVSLSKGGDRVGLALRPAPDALGTPAPGPVRTPRVTGDRLWMEHALAALNPATTLEVDRLHEDEIAAALQPYLGEAVEAGARVKAFLEAYGSLEGAHECGWVTLAVGQRRDVAGAPLGDGAEEALGLICFQPLSNGVVQGHQVSLGKARLDAIGGDRGYWARIQVRRALYLAGFERLEYLPWVRALAGCYVVKSPRTGAQEAEPAAPSPAAAAQAADDVRDGGWMARAHGGFARQQADEDAVDFPVAFVPFESQAVAAVEVEDVDVEVLGWDDAARREVRAVVAPLRSALYAEVLELDEGLEAGPTPFVASCRADDDWRCRRAFRASGPRRARRLLRARRGGRVVAVAVLDAVDWPVNLSGLLDAVRIFPVGDAAAADEPWNGVRWAILAEAGRWFQGAQVARFAFINEPARRIHGPESLQARPPAPLSLPAALRDQPRLAQLGRGKAGRFWALRRHPRVATDGCANESFESSVSLFAAFAAHAEEDALDDLRAIEARWGRE